MKKSLVIVFVAIVSSSLTAQKIKYKDLFPILDSKNYEVGGPQLITFISDPKNSEHANAHLQMGLMLEMELSKLDPISDSTSFFSKGDSVISFFGLAKNLITEKEIKKNDKYYQTFFRRDLRTGDFGIKLSDVHLDIEKKVEEVQKKIENIQSINKKLSSLSKNYQESALIYKSFVDQFLRYNAFLIGADDETNTKLSEMVTSSEKAQNDAKSIIETSKTLGSSSFSKDVIISPIDEFGRDGLIISEVTNSTLELWDFAGWALASQSEIRGSIGLFKSLVLNYAYEIREKKDKVKKGTDAEVEMLNAELIGQFQKYDPESTVEKLLRIETYETQIIKQVDISINKPLQDSTLIGAQLQIFEKAKVLADEMSVLVSSINQDDLDEVKNLYREYSDSFFQKHGTVSKYVSDMKVWSGRQVKWIDNAVEFWSEKNSWGVSGENLIPLYVENAPEANFFTLGVPVNDIDEVVVWGANMEDKKGYLIGFGPDRFEKWNIEYELPNSEIVQYVSDTVSSGLGSTSFYVFNEAATENNLAVVNYSLSGEINWQTVITVLKKPVSFKFNTTTQELTIFLYPEEELPLDSDELGYKVIDRTGTPR